MSAEAVALAGVAGAGTAMLATIAAREYLQTERMRKERVRLATRYPIGLEPAQLSAAWSGLAGLPPTTELVAEVVATEGRITHSLLVPESVRESVRAALAGAIPSLRVTDMDTGPSQTATLTLRLFVQTPSFLLTSDAASACRSLLSGMAALRRDEVVALRWALMPGSPRQRQEPTEPTARQKEVAKAWATKTASPGFSVAGLIVVRAVTRTRAREIASHIENVLRSRRGSAGGIRVSYARGHRTLTALPKVNRSSGWLNVSELVPLLALPLGDPVPGVEVGAARELLVPRHVPREGRVLFTGRDASGPRKVAIDATGARHHMAVVGPSGVGKSVLLTRAILSDIERGFGGVVIDPKADLLDSILNRIKPEHADRIVVLDPGDTRPTPGLAVLAGGDPDLRTDVLTGTLKAIFGDAWGVRSDFYGRLAIRTLSEVPGASLTDLGRLFYEDGFRRAAVARLRDPFLITSWQAYEALSPGARAEHVQAPMARVMALLSRPRVRAILASPEARLNIPKLLSERKWLLVSLAPGQLSEAGATIVGASLVYLVWSAVEARVALAPERRHPIFLYVDELSTLTSGLPFGFELLAERARGLGAGLAVAIQTLGRIPEPTRSALLGNVATFITFRAPAEEAARLSRQLPGLTDRDVMGLGRFEVAGRVGTGTGSAVSVMTGRTEPLPPETGLANSIRAASAARYGTRPEAATAAAPVSGPDDEALLGAERRRA